MMRRLAHGVAVLTIAEAGLLLLDGPGPVEQDESGIHVRLTQAFADERVIAEEGRRFVEVMASMSTR